MDIFKGNTILDHPSLIQQTHVIQPRIMIPQLYLFLQQFKFLDPSDCHLVLVRRQGHVEVYGERQKHNHYGYENYARRPGGCFAQVVELNPAEYCDFD